jgi:hypothetical protein
VIRATVVIRQRNPENVDGDGLMREWTHAHDLELGELGVTLDWGGNESTFVPWESVVRIDYERCRCARCGERQAA